MARIEMDPNAGPVVAAILVGKANEAVAVVGAPRGREVSEIGEAIGVALRMRGLNLPDDLIEKAAASIAAGEHFEFR